MKTLALAMMVVVTTMMISGRTGPATSPPEGVIPPLVLARTIDLPDVRGRIDHLACDPAGRRLFVVALENGSLEVVDLDKGARVASAGGLKEPQGVVFVPSLGRVVVACGGDGTVRAYDPVTLRETMNEQVGDDADNLRVAGDGKTILVGHGQGTLSVLDAQTLKSTSHVILPDHPEAFESDPGTQRVFVNVPGGFIAGGGRVVVGDLATQFVTVTWTLKEAGRNFPMALDAPHKRLFVGCRRPARLLVIDTDTGHVIASPECVGDVDDVFVDARSGRIYAIGGDGGGAVDIFETPDHVSYSRIASVATSPGARTGLLVPELKTLYVAVPKRADRPAQIRAYTIAD